MKRKLERIGLELSKDILVRKRYDERRKMDRWWMRANIGWKRVDVIKVGRRDRLQRNVMLTDVDTSRMRLSGRRSGVEENTEMG